MKLKFTAEINAHCSASEADLFRHLESIAEDLKLKVDGIPSNEWQNTINVSWDEYEKIDFDILIESEIE